MTRTEQVWRWILEHPHGMHQQQQVAAAVGCAIGTVHLALRVPRAVGAIQVGGRGFYVTDFAKLLVMWAVHRTVHRDIVDRWTTDRSRREAESLVVPSARFTGAAGVKWHYGELPTDYPDVWVYVPQDDVEELRRRLPESRRQTGTGTAVFVLRPDALLGPRLSVAQLYADCWQMPGWWAMEAARYVVRKEGWW